MATVMAMIIAYFVGSIPTGLWVGRAVYDIDIREHGSGNLGATNAFRVLGKFLGTMVLFIDVLKGLAPVAVLPALFGMRNVTAGTELLIGTSAIVGHIYSVFARFRGGKGVATALGVFLAVAPAEMLVVLINGIMIIFLTGYVSAASISGAVILPLLLFLNHKPLVVLVASMIICAFVIIRHRGNLQRLLSGNENKLQAGKRHIEDDLPIPIVKTEKARSDEE